MNKYFIILIVVIISTVLFFIYFNLTHIHVTIQFEELEPFKKRLTIYHNGFKLGHTTKLYPSKDFKYTYVEAIIKSKNLHMPSNVTAKIKVRDKKEYIEIISPDIATIKLLTDGSIIEGVKGLNFTSYLENQADTGGLDEIKENVNETVKSAGQTFNALTGMIEVCTDILKDVRPEIKKSSENLSITTKNLASFSTELNESVKPKILRNTFENIEKTTKNLEISTGNLNNVVLHTDRETMKHFDKVIGNFNGAVCNLNVILKNVNSVVLNINDIVKGFKVTLSKKFAGFRIVFGKAIN